jgi:hypothetical protein
VFVPGKPFQPSLMFVECSWIMPGRSWPYSQTFTGLYRYAMHKHPSLLQAFVNYGCKFLEHWDLKLQGPLQPFAVKSSFIQVQKASDEEGIVVLVSTLSNTFSSSLMLGQKHKLLFFPGVDLKKLLWCLFTKFL